MRAPLRKMGNSSGIIIPKPILIQIGVETGDDLDLSLDDGRIVLAPPDGIRAPAGARRQSASQKAVTRFWSGPSLAIPTTGTWSGRAGDEGVPDRPARRSVARSA